MVQISVQILIVTSALASVGILPSGSGRYLRKTKRYKSKVTFDDFVEVKNDNGVERRKLYVELHKWPAWPFFKKYAKELSNLPTKTEAEIKCKEDAKYFFSKNLKAMQKKETEIFEQFIYKQHIYEQQLEAKQINYQMQHELELPEAMLKDYSKRLLQECMTYMKSPSVRPKALSSVLTEQTVPQGMLLSKQVNKQEWEYLKYKDLCDRLLSPKAQQPNFQEPYKNELNKLMQENCRIEFKLQELHRFLMEIEGKALKSFDDFVEKLESAYPNDEEALHQVSKNIKQVLEQRLKRQRTFYKDKQQHAQHIETEMVPQLQHKCQKKFYDLLSERQEKISIDRLKAKLARVYTKNKNCLQNKNQELPQQAQELAITKMKDEWRKWRQKLEEIIEKQKSYQQIENYRDIRIHNLQYIEKQRHKQMDVVQSFQEKYETSIALQLVQQLGFGWLIRLNNCPCDCDCVVLEDCQQVIKDVGVSEAKDWLDEEWDLEPLEWEPQ